MKPLIVKNISTPNPNVPNAAASFKYLDISTWATTTNVAAIHRRN
jgi:hypothetical protein